MTKALLVGMLVALALLTLGCCGFTPPSSELPASFCSSLGNSNTQDLCLSSVADHVEDNQIIRDYYTYWNVIQQDADELDSIANQTTEAANAWNSAETPQAQNTAYRSYYLTAMNYATKVNVTETHLNNFENFLNQNKDFLDSHGVNTVAQINSIPTLKGILKTNLNQMQSNLEMMSSSLQLEQQQQEANQALIGTILKLVLGLG